MATANDISREIRPYQVIAAMHQFTLMCYIAVLLALVMLPSTVRAQVEDDRYRGNMRGIDRRNLDTSVDPCDDFYQFANGGWLAAQVVPADEASWTVDHEVRHRADKLIRRILESSAAGEPAEGAPPEVRRLVGDLFASAMDTAHIDALGLTPLQPDLDRVDALASTQDVITLVSELHAAGRRVLFDPFVAPDFQDSGIELLYVTQGGLGLPEKDYYLRKDSASVRLLAQYLEHVENMLVLSGTPREAAEAQAERILEMETQLAAASLGVVELRDLTNFYRPVDPSMAAETAPAIDWAAYLSRLGVADERFSFPHVQFFAEVNHMLEAVPLTDWKAYLRWYLLDYASQHLASPFEQANFRFYETVLKGTETMQPRWRRARDAVNNLAGEALGQLFVAEAFRPEAKEQALVMVDNVQAVVRDRLERLTWMEEETRRQALAKLATFTPKIGYPDKWRNYSAYHVERGDYFGNVLRGHAFEAQRNYAKAGQPVDFNEWHMVPQVVSAYYNPFQNEIVFPAGILQPPFFDPDIDSAVNYGAMGAVIGHEVMHGYDDQGSKFDARGNMVNWWTEVDRAEFERRAESLEAQFDGFVAVDTLRVNGRLTLGENIADLGGLIMAYYGFQRALKDQPRASIDGFTPEQRFFLSWAQSWRGVDRDEILRLRVQTDSHAPRRFRVNGPLQNMPEFAKTFECRAGDPMVATEPADIW